MDDFEDASWPEDDSVAPFATPDDHWWRKIGKDRRMYSGMQFTPERVYRVEETVTVERRVVANRYSMVDALPFGDVSVSVSTSDGDSFFDEAVAARKRPFFARAGKENSLPPAPRSRRSDAKERTDAPDGERSLSFEPSEKRPAFFKPNPKKSQGKSMFSEAVSASSHKIPLSQGSFEADLEMPEKRPTFFKPNPKKSEGNNSFSEAVSINSPKIPLSQGSFEADLEAPETRPTFFKPNPRKANEKNVFSEAVSINSPKIPLSQSSFDAVHEMPETRPTFFKPNQKKSEGKNLFSEAVSINSPKIPLSQGSFEADLEVPETRPTFFKPNPKKTNGKNVFSEAVSINSPKIPLSQGSFEAVREIPETRPTFFKPNPKKSEGKNLFSEAVSVDGDPVDVSDDPLRTPSESDSIGKRRKDASMPISPLSNSAMNLFRNVASSTIIDDGLIVSPRRSVRRLSRRLSQISAKLSDDIPEESATAAQKNVVDARPQTLLNFPTAENRKMSLAKLTPESVRNYLLDENSFRGRASRNVELKRTVSPLNPVFQLHILEDNTSEEPQGLNQTEIDRAVEEEMKAMRTNPPVRHSTVPRRIGYGNDSAEAAETLENDSLDRAYPSRFSRIPIAIHAPEVPFIDTSPEPEKNQIHLDVPSDKAKSKIMSGVEVPAMESAPETNSNLPIREVVIEHCSAESDSPSTDKSKKSLSPSDVCSEAGGNDSKLSAESTKEVEIDKSATLGQNKSKTPSDVLFEVEGNDSKLSAESPKKDKVDPNSDKSVSSGQNVKDVLSISANKSKIPTDFLSEVEGNDSKLSAESPRGVEIDPSSDKSVTSGQNVTHTLSNKSKTPSDVLSEAGENDSKLSGESPKEVEIDSNSASTYPVQNVTNVLSISANKSKTPSEMLSEAGTERLPEMDVEMESNSDASTSPPLQNVANQSLENKGAVVCEVADTSARNGNTLLSNVLSEAIDNFVPSTNCDESSESSKTASADRDSEKSEIGEKLDTRADKILSETVGNIFVLSMETESNSDKPTTNTESEVVINSKPNTSENMFILSAENVDLGSPDNNSTVASFSKDSLEEDEQNEEASFEASANYDDVDMSLSQSINARSDSSDTDSFRRIDFRTVHRREGSERGDKVIAEMIRRARERKRIALEILSDDAKLEESTRRKVTPAKPVEANSPVGPESNRAQTTVPARKRKNERGIGETPAVEFKKPKLYMKESWITKHLYGFLQKKLASRYGCKAKMKSEKFVIHLSKVVGRVVEAKDDASDDVASLKHLMAKLNIVRSHMDFHRFCHDYMPYYFQIKAIPACDRSVRGITGSVFDPIMEEDEEDDEETSRAS